MPSFRIPIRLAVALALSAFATLSSAAVTTISNWASFNSQGTISENSNFDDFDHVGFSFPGDPFTRGSVTYTSQRNLIAGSCCYSIGATRPVMTNDWWTPITGTIAGMFDLFGFDAAVTSGPVSITVDTNLGSYLFPNLVVANGSPNFTFEGFRTTGAGEYFTGFRIDTLGQGYLPGITNVALGSVSPVPEPASLGLLLAGAAMVGASRLRRRKS